MAACRLECSVIQVVVVLIIPFLKLKKGYSQGGGVLNNLASLSIRPLTLAFFKMQLENLLKWSLLIFTKWATLFFHHPFFVNCCVIKMMRTYSYKNFSPIWMAKTSNSIVFGYKSSSAPGLGFTLSAKSSNKTMSNLAPKGQRNFFKRLEDASPSPAQSWGGSIISHQAVLSFLFGQVKTQELKHCNEQWCTCYTDR